MKRFKIVIKYRNGGAALIECPDRRTAVDTLIARLNVDGKKIYSATLTPVEEE